MCKRGSAGETRKVRVSAPLPVCTDSQGAGGNTVGSNRSGTWLSIIDKLRNEFALINFSTLYQKDFEITLTGGGLVETFIVIEVRPSDDTSP